MRHNRQSYSAQLRDQGKQIGIQLRQAIALLLLLYSFIKSADADICFVFLNGVRKFGKVSLFSGLKNFNDITNDPEYSGLCGYAEADLDTLFAPELPGLEHHSDPHLVQRLQLGWPGGLQPLR